MLATTLGIEFDPDQAWEERETYLQGQREDNPDHHICQSAQGRRPASGPGHRGCRIPHRTEILFLPPRTLTSFIDSVVARDL